MRNYLKKTKKRGPKQDINIDFLNPNNYMPKKNIAIIGAGYWGKKLIRVFNSFGVLKSVCDIDPKIIKKRKKEYPEIEMTTNLKYVLRNSKIKAIVIATPASTHYYLAKKAIKAGKDILVEKPFTLKLKGGQELARLAEKNKNILMVDHLFLFHPALEQIKKIIKKGKLGKIFYLNSNRLNLGIIREKENALWSLAPHDISMIIEIMGKLPQRVWARGMACLGKKKIDIVNAKLCFKNNVGAEFFVSWLNPEKERKLVILGTKGMLVFDDMTPDRLKFYAYRIKIIRNKITKFAKIEARKTKEKPIKILDEEPLKNMAKHFLKCLANRKNPKSGAKEALNVIKVLEACEKSINNNGKPIKI